MPPSDFLFPSPRSSFFRCPVYSWDIIRSVRPAPRLPQVLKPDVPLRPVHRVRARQGQGKEEGARAGLLRGLLLLERLPLQPPAGEGFNHLEEGSMWEGERHMGGGFENPRSCGKHHLFHQLLRSSLVSWG